MENKFNEVYYALKSDDTFILDDSTNKPLLFDDLEEAGDYKEMWRLSDCKVVTMILFEE